MHEFDRERSVLVDAPSECIACTVLVNRCTPSVSTVRTSKVKREIADDSVEYLSLNQDTVRSLLGRNQYTDRPHRQQR